MGRSTHVDWTVHPPRLGRIYGCQRGLRQRGAAETTWAMTQTQQPTERGRPHVGAPRTARRHEQLTGDDYIDLEDFPPSDGFDELDRTEPSWTDPRFLVPLTLFLAAVLVIGLALRANGRLDEPALVTVDQTVLDVSSAQTRAGFDGVSVRRDGELIVLEGQAQSSADAAAIGAVARSVEGVISVDNRIVIVQGVVETAVPSTVTPASSEPSLADRLTAAGSITFEPASAAITDAGIATVDAVAAILADAPAIPLEVHGHTDSDGDSTVNQRLSQDRAQAVVDALIARGVGPDRLTSVGFGESDPLAPNITEEGRAKNRRIEFALRP